MTPMARLPIVVDTNVVSYIYRGDPVGQPYLDRIGEHRPFISIQTYEEIMFGVIVNNWGQARIRRLLRYVNANYDIIEANDRLAVICSRLRAQSRRIGRELSAADAWIAATAVLLNCPLLSHDRDFGNLPGLEVIHYESPADDAQH